MSKQKITLSLKRFSHSYFIITMALPNLLDISSVYKFYLPFGHNFDLCCLHIYYQSKNINSPDIVPCSKPFLHVSSTFSVF
jgi:hypothetical protein